MLCNDACPSNDCTNKTTNNRKVRLPLAAERSSLTRAAEHGTMASAHLGATFFRGNKHSLIEGHCRGSAAAMSA